MKCLRCQHETQSPASFCPECGTPVIAVTSSAGSYTELQTENTTLRDQQAATADILRVISSSPADVQPVFDAIARHAVALCDGAGAVVVRYDGAVMRLAAYHNVSKQSWAQHQTEYPRPPDRAFPLGAVIVDRAIVHVPNLQASTQFAGSPVQRAGYGSMIGVPLVRHGEAVGAIGITRDGPEGFSGRDIALLETFADQAVIAIENVRVFTELQTSNRELAAALDTQTATADILRVISRSPTDVQPVFDAIVASAVRLLGAYSGIRDRAPFNIADAHTDPRLPEAMHAYARVRGYRSQVVVPLLRHDEAIGTISLTRGEPGGFTVDEISLLQTFADQAVIAIENVRLFKELQSRTEELEAKGQQLEAASQHKSEFLANMSHELRTPLNAVIGFSEVLNEGMFGELNEKQADYLKDIHASGQHLLSLINDILDLSKIEAGRMELERADFNLPATLHNALTLVRERAARRSIALNLSVDERLDQIQADERKIRQVVLNLLSNALKFTPEGGRIDVRAIPADGSVHVSVTDTGVGIAPEDQEAIFEEFKQVGTASKKVEGTGLGLALSRKFIELHGGRIWVKSQIGEGSSFTFSIPATS